MLTSPPVSPAIGLRSTVMARWCCPFPKKKQRRTDQTRTPPPRTLRAAHPNPHRTLAPSTCTELQADPRRPTVLQAADPRATGHLTPHPTPPPYAAGCASSCRRTAGRRCGPLRRGPAASLAGDGRGGWGGRTVDGGGRLREEDEGGRSAEEAGRDRRAGEKGLG